MHFRRKVVSRFFAVLLSVTALLMALPGTAHAAGEYRIPASQFSSSFVHRSKINVSKFQVTQADKDAGRVSDDFKDLSVAQINNIISQQIVGNFVSNDATNIDADYIRDNGNCDSRIKKQGNGYQLDQPKAIREGKGCKEVLTVDLVLVDGSTIDMTNFFVMFNWKNQNTLTRVDGRDGDFVQSENEESKYFRIEEAGKDHQDFVTLNSATAGSYTRGISDAPDVTVNIEVAQSSIANRTNPPSDPNSVNNQPDATGEQRSCESEGGDLSWILCPVIFLGDAIMNGLDEALKNVLEVPNKYFEDPSLRTAWSRMRNIAYIILVPAVMLMVISTALGFEFVSAYTVRKALPRLIMATIFIALSFDITTYMIIFTNNVGNGIGGLIQSAFAGSGDISLASIFTPDGGDSALALPALVAAGFAGAAIASIGIVMSYLLIGVVGLLVGFILLSLRQMILIALVLLAPLAILAWIFPSNDKLWKTWWGTFSKLLLLYPLIMVLLATGKSFAFMMSSMESNLITTLLKLTAYIGPYFLIPSTFKLAGGAFATISNMANDRERGLFDRQRKYRQAKGAENLAKTRNYGRFSDRNKFTRGLNTALGAGANPRDLARGRAGVRAGRHTGRSNQGAEIFKSDPTMAAHQNDDNFLLAIANERLAKQKLAAVQSKFEKARQDGDMEGMNKYQAEIDARSGALNNAQRVNSRKTGATRMAALQQLAASGYQFEAGRTGYQELASTVQDITGGDTAAYSSAMNNAQYNLKNAGRYDLGGLNNGQGYSVESGLNKASLYQLANGKTDSLKAWGAELGDTTGPLSPEQMKKAAVQYKELDSMKSNATGSNRDEIVRQMRLLESRGITTYMSQPSGETDPAGKALTNADLASREARAYERIDPNKIT